MTFDIHCSQSEGQRIRCAEYRRYSSDNSDPLSLEEQHRNCEIFAAEKNWAILPEYVRSDAGISGAALATRHGLLSLLEDAKRKPRPFDCVLIDDTSRMGRNLADVLKVSDVFRFNDVFLYFVTQELDSRDKNYKKILIANGAQDEDFLEGLRNKVRRAMKYKFLKGWHMGGTRYGYRRVLIEDPTRKDEHGRPAIDHSELEKHPEESKIVLRISMERAGGALLSDIARTLNSQGIKGPRGGTWTYTAVRDILRNELYRGVVRWNRTRNDTDPESGKKRVRNRPEKEWLTVEVPELQIIPDELWERVQEIDRRMKRAGRAALGGEHRTPTSRTYLFSRVLKCGSCSEGMSILKNDSERAWYGCRGHYYGRLCQNNVLIERKALEGQLLEAIAFKLRPEVLDEFIDPIKEQIESYLKRESSGADSSDSLKKQLAELKEQQKNIVRAMARCPDSEGLDEELSSIESRIKQLKQQLVKLNHPAAAVSFQAFRDFVFSKARNLASILAGDPVMAKQAINQAIRQLILTPVQTECGPMLEVSGDIQLFAQISGVMPSFSVEQSAKHYAFPLSLTGLQLDPRKSGQAPVSNRDVSDLLDRAESVHAAA